MRVPFKQVDVFTDQPFRGNPVAVILDGTSLSDAQMLQIANWTNLSETTFVLPATRSDADYRVRIFTPTGELPFAGHPTLGTAHALIEAGKVRPQAGRLVQECDAGLIRLNVGEVDGGRRITLELPTPRHQALNASQADALDALLGQPVLADFPARMIDVGPKWVVAQLASASAVLALTPDLVRMAQFDRALGSTGVTVFGAYEAGAEAAIEVRSFAPSQGMTEDPVCGSGNGCVAVFIRETGQTERFGAHYRSAQGRCLGRNGKIDVQIEADGVVRLGGQSVTCVDGTITLA